jgi:hypothetical protein
MTTHALFLSFVIHYLVPWVALAAGVMALAKVWQGILTPVTKTGLTQ